MNQNNLRRKYLTLEQRIEILQDFDQGLARTKIRAKFNCTDNVVKRVLQNRSKLIDEYEFKQHERVLYLKYEHINFLIYKWFKLAQKYNASISGPILQRKAELFGKILNQPHFRGSNGWLRSFTKRNDIRLMDLPSSKTNEYGVLIYAWEYSLLKDYFDSINKPELYENAVKLLEDNQNKCEMESILPDILSDNDDDDNTKFLLKRRKTSIEDKENISSSNQMASSSDIINSYAIYVKDEPSLHEEFIIKDEIDEVEDLNDPIAIEEENEINRNEDILIANNAQDDISIQEINDVTNDDDDVERMIDTFKIAPDKVEKTNESNKKIMEPIVEEENEATQEIQNIFQQNIPQILPGTIPTLIIINDLVPPLADFQDNNQNSNLPILNVLQNAGFQDMRLPNSSLQTSITSNDQTSNQNSNIPSKPRVPPPVPQNIVSPNNVPGTSTNSKPRKNVDVPKVPAFGVNAEIHRNIVKEKEPDIVIIDTDDEDDQSSNKEPEVVNEIPVPLETLEESKHTLSLIKHVALLLNDDKLLEMLDDVENRIGKHVDDVKNLLDKK